MPENSGSLSHLDQLQAATRERLAAVIQTMTPATELSPLVAVICPSFRKAIGREALGAVVEVL